MKDLGVMPWECERAVTYKHPERSKFARSAPEPLVTRRDGQVKQGGVKENGPRRVEPPRTKTEK